jgi:hypothetical protein
MRSPRGVLTPSRATPQVPGRPVVAAAVVGSVLAAAYLLAPPMGADLSAQVAHAQLAERQWPALLDLRWYGGYQPLGYSVLSPLITALIGVRVATALGYLVGVVLFAVLLQRFAVSHREAASVAMQQLEVTDAPQPHDAALARQPSIAVIRPTAGAIVGAACFTGNLASTRTAFTLGLAAALGTVVAVAYHRGLLTSVLAIIAALISPVAGLFLGVVGAALMLSGWRRDGITVGVSALVPTVFIGVVFGNGGRMSFGTDHAITATIGCLVVAAVCWRQSLIRWGALLSAAMVAAAYALPTPVGSNAARLPELFAPAIIIAVAALPAVIVTVVAAAVAWFLPPLFVDEIRDRGEPALDAAYYTPLLEQLHTRQITGPIEVVPLRRHGEAAVVAPEVPIARGWLRQIDIDRNPLFYGETLDAEAYRNWLDNNAVGWVAAASSRHDWAANEEAALVSGGLPYLEPVWSDAVWTLYAVTNPRPIISAPGRVRSRDDISLTVELPEPGQYEVRVHWSRFLGASAGCVRESADGWSVVVVRQPGTVLIEGDLTPRRCS